jgi:hypothetical protein
MMYYFMEILMQKQLNQCIRIFCKSNQVKVNFSFKKKPISYQRKQSLLDKLD